MVHNIKGILRFVSVAALVAVTYSLSLAQQRPHRPDLVVRVTGPGVVAAGQDISQLVGLHARNQGIASF
jgi:hypothetical protein